MDETRQKAAGHDLDRHKRQASASSLERSTNVFRTRTVRMVYRCKVLLVQVAITRFKRQREQQDDKSGMHLGLVI